MSTMAIRKYQKVEKAKRLTPEEEARIAANLAKVSKISATQLNDTERKSVLDTER